jgi:hypothetical protein
MSSSEDEKGSMVDPDELKRKEQKESKPESQYSLFQKLDRIADNLEKQTQAIIKLTEALNNLLTSFVVKDEKVEPRPQSSSPLVPEKKPEPSPKPSPELKFNVVNITWEKRTGERGEFEIAEKEKNQNNDYVELEKLLKSAGGSMSSEGFFYWLFQDGKAIGRKPSKGGFKKKEEPQQPLPPPLPKPEEPKTPPSKIDEVKTLFPEDLENMLSFEDKTDYVIVKPRQFLGSENFAKIASVVRGAGGEYVSAGKASHFRIPIKR